MITFLTVFIILQALTIIGKVMWVAKDVYPERKRSDIISDIFIGFILVVWAINLIVLN